MVIWKELLKLEKEKIINILRIAYIESNITEEFMNEIIKENSEEL